MKKKFLSPLCRRGGLWTRTQSDIPRKPASNLRKLCVITKNQRRTGTLICGNADERVVITIYLSFLSSPPRPFLSLNDFFCFFTTLFPIAFLFLNLHFFFSIAEDLVTARAFEIRAVDPDSELLTEKEERMPPKRVSKPNPKFQEPNAAAEPHCIDKSLSNQKERRTRNGKNAGLDSTRCLSPPRDFNEEILLPTTGISFRVFFVRPFIDWK